MIIKQPPNKSINTPNGALDLKWTNNFGRLTSEKFQKAQEFVDESCIRFMKPYTPFKTGFLEKSATLGTVIGSGEIRQIMPYARYLYYGKLMVSSTTGSSWAKLGEKKVLTDKDLQYDTKTKHPQAGKLWFERMKADRKDDILRGAAKIVGGTVK